MKTIFGYIYETKNLLREKYYIGQKSEPELDVSYFGSGKLIIRALKRHGKENFSVKLIAVAYSQKELDDLEVKFIAQYRMKYGTKNVYNIDAGGYLRGANFKFSEIHKKRLSLALRGRKLTEDHKRNIGLGRLGHIVTKETRDKISEGNSGRKMPKYVAEKLLQANLGRGLSSEHKMNLSKASLGKRKSESHTQAIKNSLYNTNRELYYQLKEENRTTGITEE